MRRRRERRGGRRTSKRGRVNRIEELKKYIHSQEGDEITLDTVLAYCSIKHGIAHRTTKEYLKDLNAYGSIMWNGGDIIIILK